MEQDTARTQFVRRRRNDHKPTPDEWEALRQAIRQLYIDENKTLSEVAKILETVHSFRASPKQYKRHFKEWGFWKNLSTTDAARLLEVKRSRDGIGKQSVFMRSGQKVAFDRVQKTVRRSKNRRPRRIHVEGSVPQPTRAVECRTPSPEPGVTENDLDPPNNLDSYSLHADNIELTQSGSFRCQVPSCILSFTASDPEQFELFDSGRYEDPYVEVIRDCYMRVHRKLALRYGCSQTNTDPDEDILRFRRTNSLLAVLEPILAGNGHHFKRELFLANFGATFLHRPELRKFAQSVYQTIGLDLSRHAAVVTNTLQYLGLQSYTLQFIHDSDDMSHTGALSYLYDSTAAPTFECSDDLTLPVDLLSPSREIPPNLPPNSPSYNECSDYPQPDGLEAAAFAYHLGEVETAETLFRAFTCYDGSVSKKAEVLTRLAWYCLSRVQRTSAKVEEADKSLMQAIRGYMFYPAAHATDWEDVSYLFI